MVNKFDSSDNVIDDHGSDDKEWKTKGLGWSGLLRTTFCSALILTPSIIWHISTRVMLKLHDRADQVGWYLMETLSTPRGTREMFKMHASIFYVSTYGLKADIHIKSLETLAMFLVACGHGWSNSVMQYIFKHSRETS